MNKHTINAQNLVADAKEFVAGKAKEERGDSFSYLVLVLGLVVAAAAAVGPLGGVISGLVSNIGNEAGVPAGA